MKNFFLVIFEGKDEKSQPPMEVARTQEQVIKCVHDYIDELISLSEFLHLRIIVKEYVDRQFVDEYCLSDRLVFADLEQIKMIRFQNFVAFINETKAEKEEVDQTRNYVYHIT
jgi:hypothetical protein